MAGAALAAAPSTMFRMVSLPRFTGEEPSANGLV